jgi:hypothetical protein
MKRRRDLLKTSRYLLLIMLTGFVVNSCEVAESLLNDVGKLEGEWTCDETSEYFKKTTASVYSVYISPDADNVNGIIMDGFYNLGDVGAIANVSGLTITIPSQSLEGGYTILSGTGTISSNYKTITWSYNINIGGDAVDHVTAVYTKN